MATRDELQSRLVALAADAAAAEYYILASSLYYIAGSFAGGWLDDLNGVIARWWDIKQRRN